MNNENLNIILDTDIDKNTAISNINMSNTNMLNYVFKTIIRETLNIDKAIEDMKHSIVYYTNFIEQIEENLMYDLNISSNNASIFVYKKTINQIKLNNYLKNNLVN